MIAPLLAQTGFGGSLLTIALAIVAWAVARMVLRVRGDVRKLHSEVTSLTSLKSEIADLRSELAAFKELRADLESLKATPTHAPVAVPAPAPAAPAPAKPADQLTPEMLSAIIAAVAYTLGNTHEIVSISAADSLVWSREGRRNIFSSHSLR